MNDQIRERTALATAGAAQGLAIWLLVETSPESQAARAATVAALTFLAVTAAVFHFAWTNRDLRRLITLTIGCGLLYAAVAGWVGWSMPIENHYGSGGNERGFVWFMTSLVTLYVLGPFLQIYQRTGRIRFPYHDLFVHGWNNFFVALVGGLFAGALWTVLLLWAALFNMIGIDFFEDLFTEAVFAWAVSGAATGFGIALGRESERVISTLRGITLAVFRGLLPLVSGVALIFLATLPFTGLDSLWSTNNASRILLTWVGLTVLFFNAVYQDGPQGELPQKSLPRLIRWLVEAGLVAMLFFVAISIYGISLRIGQHGLTPSRMWGVLFAIVLGGYAAGYTAAVVRRGDPWLPNVPGVNRFVALLVVALGLLVHTPVLDPAGWSARNQVARLISGRVSADAFDYGYLSFKLGRQGWEKLNALEALESHPDLETIRDGVIAARGADNYRGWKKHHGPSLSPELFEVIPAGTKLPDSLLAAARVQIQDYVRSACTQGKTCTAFRADLDAQAPEEWILVVGHNRYNPPYVFRENGENFEFLGRLHQEGEAPEPQGFKAHLRASRVRSLAPRYQDLEIGETRYHLVPK